jgi:hypothetical protein
MSRRRDNLSWSHLLDAARVVEAIPQLGNGDLPNEAQARELAPLRQ